jgi:hypothetical protein
MLSIISDYVAGDKYDFITPKSVYYLNMSQSNIPASCMGSISHDIIDLSWIRGFPAVSDQIL